MGTVSVELVVLGAVFMAGYGRIRRYRRRHLALRRLREATGPTFW